MTNVAELAGLIIQRVREAAAQQDLKPLLEVLKTAQHVYAASDCFAARDAATFVRANGLLQATGSLFFIQPIDDTSYFFIDLREARVPEQQKHGLADLVCRAFDTYSKPKTQTIEDKEYVADDRGYWIGIKTE